VRNRKRKQLILPREDRKGFIEKVKYNYKRKVVFNYGKPENKS
jgi:hypothetical protein